MSVEIRVEALAKDGMTSTYVFQHNDIFSAGRV